MAEYIDRELLYREVAKVEEIARNRVVDTPFSSPAYQRYPSQLSERTAMKHLIADFPTADVEPVRHGRWEYVGENSTGKIFRCSACKFPHNPNKRDIGLIRVDEKPNYCPNCGAKMDEEVKA